MLEKIENHDFIELEFTGKTAVDNLVFDTNIEAVAKSSGLQTEKSNFKPVTICVGEKQLLPGLDEELPGKEIGKDYEIKLGPEQAFGKRNVKKIQLVPVSTFHENKMNPQPGLQVDFDGKMGTVMRVSGGRVMVNFNHPLAGKDVIYEIKVIKKITDPKLQLESYLKSTTQLPENMIGVDVKEDKATIEMPFDLPEQFSGELTKKLCELTKLKEVKFTKKEPAKEEVVKKEEIKES
jgi:FKBP-type peptidyl-prolyl cis-trans isomerase 2